MTRHTPPLPLMSLFAAALLATAPVSACDSVVSWQADLAGAASPGNTAPAGGTATYVFDFARPQATVVLDTRGLQNVTAVELHTGYPALEGPLAVTLYTGGRGALPEHWQRRIGPADLLPAPGVRTFAELAHTILNGGAYVCVRTKSHPEGALRGQIIMHKTLIYSTGGALHDPRLHQQARASAPAAGGARP